MGGPDSFWEATWPFPAERTFCRGIFGLDSVWEGSWLFPTGRTLGLGMLRSVSVPRQHQSNSVFVHRCHRQVQSTLGRITK